MRRNKWLLVLCAMLLIWTTACSNDVASGTDKGLTKVKLMLDWTPNTNHTGLYVAIAKGYFKEEGLDVEILQPGKTTTEAAVGAGQIDFGVSVQENVTFSRTQQVPILSIGAIIQHNTSGFASPMNKNIKSPKDFVGKTYGGYGSPTEKPIIQALMTKEQADVNKVKFLNIGSVDFFTAVKRDVDFSWIYQGWTGIESELRGEKLNMIYLTDYAKELDYYTPVLITSEQKAKQDPETVRKFMKAVSKGYQFAIESPDEAAEILIKAEPDLNPELVRKSQQWLSPRYQAEAKQWGHQERSVWDNYAQFLQKNNLLEGKFNPDEAFTNQFLPQGGK